MKKYDSYKDSGVEWIGKIPTNWTAKRLSYSIAIQKGKIPKNLTSEKLIDSLPYLSMGVLRGDKPMEFSNENGIVHVSKGDIGLLWDGSNSGEVIRINREGILSSTVSLLSLKDNSINKEFCFYLLKFYENDFKENTIGMGIPHVSGDHVRESKLIIPPYSEQLQIAFFLNTKTLHIDSLIEKTQRKIELLKEKRTSLINEAVTKGLNPDVEMKDSGVEWIGEIPSHYQMTSIKFLVTTPVSDGPHETPKFIDEGGIPFLSVEGVVGNKIDFEKVRGYISEELHQQYSKKCKPIRNDVLLVKSGSTTGKSTIVETDLEFNIWSPLCVIRSNTNKIIPRFTFQTFQSGYFRLLIENNWSYGTQPNIGMGVIENLRIVVPPKSEQTQIVEYLDHQTQKIDKSITIEGARIDLLKEYRQSLISSVVTGKIKVTEDAY